MDIEMLVNMVFEEKCLWDQSESTYHLRDHQRKAWQTISDEMEIPVNELKKKWRGMRDTFVRELKKCGKKSGGHVGEAEHDSKWPYYNNMLFLQSTLPRRDAAAAATPQVESVYVSDGEMDANDNNSYDALSDETNAQKIMKTPFKHKCKRHKTNAMDAEPLKVAIEAPKCCQHEANGPDGQFLMSLLPFLRDVPKHRKLFVRNRLQQVFIDEVNAIKVEDI